MVHVCVLSLMCGASLPNLAGADVVKNGDSSSNGGAAPDAVSSQPPPSVETGTPVEFGAVRRRNFAETAEDASGSAGTDLPQPAMARLPDPVCVAGCSRR